MARMMRKITPQTRPPIGPVDKMGQHALLDVLTARDNVRIIFYTNTPKSIKTECTLMKIGPHQWVLTCLAMHTAQLTFHSFFASS